ncbi:hypothetical protein [Chitinophaga varians]|uniref:hypothetical protein n=1 Tax=Chitinophaga varians TaxID=2202339 RepID=UPI001CB72D7C|nr:hypothetical protein [Chitinophaga varians]
MGRPSQKNYQGWWRSFCYAIILAEKYGFEKIIHVESDFYITSSRMMSYMKDLESGWTTFYSRFHQFPESAIQVICMDAFPLFRALYNQMYLENYVIDKSAELYLPFTKVEETFIGDRLGQLDVFEAWMERLSGPVSLDYVGQVLPEFRPADFAPFFEFEHTWQ